MLSRLSLRLRVLLFFALLALGGMLIMNAALVVGFRSALSDGISNGFITAGLLAGFGFLGLVTGIWLLFDENVAKPIQALATTLRARAHAGAGEVDTHGARYLGDLASAAESISSTLDSSRSAMSQKVADETEVIREELAQMSDVLRDLPTGLLVVGDDDRIVLYNSEAAACLSQIAPMRLNAAMSDYFDAETWRVSKARAANGALLSGITLNRQDGAKISNVSVQKRRSETGYLICLEPASAKPKAATVANLTYDFQLLSDRTSDKLHNRRLDQTPFVVFDCETTGLLPHKDEILQLGAVRVFRNQIIYGEEIDQLANPGRPIPAASTRIHHITDAMVTDAPPPKTLVTKFHHFARDSVIVAHNAPFDMAFMHRHGNEMQIDWPHPILDTVLLSAVLFGTSEKHTLDALCERLGVTIPPHRRHTALGDALATAEVLCRMLPMLSARGCHTLSDLLSQTRKHGRLLNDMN
ncbi:exonuclease domain-containing protein [Shimia sp.]|uniref:3'-5' exonuclease n=1 Tax=Shimia sp. TaxID=1954381 RepID=UPI003BA84277